MREIRNVGCARKPADHKSHLKVVGTIERQRQRERERERERERKIEGRTGVEREIKSERKRDKLTRCHL